MLSKFFSKTLIFSAVVAMGCDSPTPSKTLPSCRMTIEHEIINGKITSIVINVSPNYKIVARDPEDVQLIVAELKTMITALESSQESMKAGVQDVATQKGNPQ